VYLVVDPGYTLALAQMISQYDDLDFDLGGFDFDELELELGQDNLMDYQYSTSTAETPTTGIDTNNNLALSVRF